MPESGLRNRFMASTSCVSGLARQHEGIDAQQFDGRDVTLLDGEVEQDIGRGAHRQPAIAAVLVFQLARAPA